MQSSSASLNADAPKWVPSPVGMYASHVCSIVDWVHRRPWVTPGVILVDPASSPKACLLVSLVVVILRLCSIGCQCCQISCFFEEETWASWRCDQIAGKSTRMLGMDPPLGDRSPSPLCCASLSFRRTGFPILDVSQTAESQHSLPGRTCERIGLELSGIVDAHGPSVCNLVLGCRSVLGSSWRGLSSVLRAPSLTSSSSREELL